MIAEEFMVANCDAIRAASGGQTACWVYRNGVKALPWHASVRRLLEDRAQWGLFMPLAGCNPAPGVYTCGANASQNLYHDFEETPSAHTFRCGAGIECGEYVFNHRNASLRDFFLGDYFFPKPFPKSVTGCKFSARACPARCAPVTFPTRPPDYVDDAGEKTGPTEMDKDAVAKMGMTPADVTAMIAAWAANVQAYRDALVAAELFEWYLLDGGQQTAPGQNQTCGQCTCQTFLEAQCSANASAQSGTLFYGYSRSVHTQPWPLPTPDQDLAMFLLARGPYAFFGCVKRARALFALPSARPPSPPFPSPCSLLPRGALALTPPPAATAGRAAYPPRAPSRGRRRSSASMVRRLTTARKRRPAAACGRGISRTPTCPSTASPSRQRFR
jgi:hypothetical protein